MNKTRIEWCDYVWNPVSGCTKVSAGCAYCYAESMAHRFWGERKFSDVLIHPDKLNEPLKLRKPAKIFVNSMSDLFHPDVPDEFIHDVFSHMLGFGNNRHTFMILTKRQKRMLALLGSDPFFKFWLAAGTANDFDISHVWLGVSVEDQKTADERIPILLQTPAAHRFISVEPMLGAVDFNSIIMPDGDHLGKLFNHGTGTGIDWVICGGETGPGARPIQREWVIDLRDQCVGVSVPFFFKQWGGKANGNHLHIIDGVEWHQFPEEMA